MSGTVESPPTASGDGIDASLAEHGRAEAPTGSRITVSRTGELLELHLSDKSMAGGHEGVTSEVLGLYDQALAQAKANAATGNRPDGALPRRRR